MKTCAIIIEVLFSIFYYKYSWLFMALNCFEICIFFWCPWENILNQVVNLLWLISNPAKYSDFFHEHVNSPVLREYSICIRGCMVGIQALKLYPSYTNRRHRQNNVLNETEAPWSVAVTVCIAPCPFYSTYNLDKIYKIGGFVAELHNQITSLLPFHLHSDSSSNLGYR